MKPLRSGRMLAVCLPRAAMVMSRQGAAKGIYGSLILLQPGPVWMTVTFIATKGHKGAQ